MLVINSRGLDTLVVWSTSMLGVPCFLILNWSIISCRPNFECWILHNHGSCCTYSRTTIGGPLSVKNYIIPWSPVAEFLWPEQRMLCVWRIKFVFESKTECCIFLAFSSTKITSSWGIPQSVLIELEARAIPFDMHSTDCICSLLFLEF